MKISIICPTLHQTNEQGVEYLELVKKQVEGYELIIIEDMLVNEAWNKGVKQANGDVILVINDDIIIQELVFDTLKTLKRGQVYCPYFTRKDNFNKIYSYNGENIVGFCFGMYKDDWKDIPDDLKLRFGDNYIYQYMNKNILWGGYIHHWESKTLFAPERKEIIENIIEQDKINWKKYETNNLHS